MAVTEQHCTILFNSDRVQSVQQVRGCSLRVSCVLVVSWDFVAVALFCSSKEGKGEIGQAGPPLVG